MDREPWTGSERQLLVVEPTSEGHRLSMVRPGGERAPLPIVGITDRPPSQWVLDGDMLAASDEYRSIWTWTEEAETPLELRPGMFYDDSVTLSTATDTRYLKITTRGSTDVPGYFASVIDLQNGSLVHTHSGCGESWSFFGWHGDGPSAVKLGNTCQGLGEVTEYDLTYSTPSGSSSLFEIVLDDVPTLRMSQRSDLLYVEYEDRWRLLDLESRQFVLERPIEGAGIRTAWSPDGRRLYRVEGAWLAAYDATGAEPWRTDLGIQPVSLAPSPVGDRLLVMSGDCNSGSCVVLVDAETGSPSFSMDPRTGASWAPSGTALVLGPSIHEPDGAYLWMDLDTRETRELASSCGAPSWSPDGEAFICVEACEDEAGETTAEQRLWFFDSRGLALADAPCAEYSDPLWSPDSDLVAFTVTEPGETPQDDRHRVVLLDLEGGSIELGPGSISQGGWRPGPVR